MGFKGLLNIRKDRVESEPDLALIGITPHSDLTDILITLFPQQSDY
jgi:hypothetical protein